MATGEGRVPLATTANAARSGTPSPTSHGARVSPYQNETHMCIKSEVHFSIYPLHRKANIMAQVTISNKVALQLEDGTVKLFDSKREAEDYVRKPLVVAALKKLEGVDAELADWLFEQRDSVAEVFEAAKVKRVSKSDKAALEAAIKLAVETLDKGDMTEKKARFLIENADQIVNSFRWPAVKRGTEEEQAAQVQAAALDLCGGEEGAELASFIVANKDAILSAFEQGVVKRQVSEKAAAGLAAYRERMAAAKAAKAAASE